MAASSYLKEQRRRKKSERNTLESRKKEVDNIKNKIYNEIDDYIVSVNNMIYTCSSSFSAGLKGKKGGITTDIISEKEKNIYSDSKINGSRSKLQDESNRCQKRIDILNKEISSLDSKIRTAEYEEEQAIQKALEEFLNL